MSRVLSAAAPFRPAAPPTHRWLYSKPNHAAQPTNGRRLQGRRGGGALLAGHRRGGAADRCPGRPPAAPLPGAAGARLPVVRRRVRPLPPRWPAAVPARLRLARPHLPLAGLHRQPLQHPRAPPPLGCRRHHPYGRRHHAYILGKHSRPPFYILLDVVIINKVKFNHLLDTISSTFWWCLPSSLFQSGIFGEMLGSGRATPKLVKFYSPFLVIAVALVLRGLCLCSDLEVPAYAVSSVESSVQKKRV